MEGRFAEELYSESLRLSESKLPQPSIPNTKQDVSGDVCRDGDGNFWEEDELFSDVSPRELNKTIDLDREWQTRRDQFHTIGYRDGLIAGKEASAQGGFNIGFKQSVFVGYDWGIVRGVTSVLACLSDELKEKLIDSPEKVNSFENLHKSVHSVSASDALRLFNQEITAKSSFDEPNFPNRNSDSIPMRKFIGEFQTLLSDSSSLDVHFPGYR